MDADLLGTGEVARICGVTRDAVLKWIKQGKLAAVRTAGGHFRVHRKDCQEIRGVRSVRTTSPLPAPPEARASEPARCWEYFGEEGVPREACRNCLVYLAGAQRCYRLAELGKTAGHQLHFCRTDCRTCDYYRACQGQATEVLVISLDVGWSSRLRDDADPASVSIRSARSGYEASAVISSFRPAVVVVDSDLPEVKDGRLTASVLEDERIPGALVAVALRQGDLPPPRHERLQAIPDPFTGDDIEELALKVTRTLQPAHEGPERSRRA